jgi:hypothetical protein
MLVVCWLAIDLKIHGGEEARMGRLYHVIGMGPRIWGLIRDMLWDH